MHAATEPIEENIHSKKSLLHISVFAIQGNNTLRLNKCKVVNLTSKMKFEGITPENPNLAGFRVLAGN